MRKQGEYISDKRLKFKKGYQEKLIDKTKETSGLTWAKLANSLDISESTIKDWRYKNSSLPNCIVKKILKKYPFESFENIKEEWVEEVLDKNWGQRKGGGHNLKKITIPVKNEEFAEFLGIVLGDGHVNSKEITIVGNSDERAHHDYVERLCIKLFNVKPKRFINYINENTMMFDIYSKNVINLLKENGFKEGDKIKKKSSLPEWVFSNKKFVYGALRGLFDTDGGIYSKQKKYKRALIELQTYSPYIRKDMIRLVEEAGFTFSKSSYNIRIQNQEEIHKFFKLVGSSNPKNIIRYKHFILNGDIPLANEMKNEIINFKGNLPFKRL